MERELLIENAERIARETAGETVLLTDAKLLAFLLENCEITIPEASRFFVRVNCEGMKREIDKQRWIALRGGAFLAEFRHAYACKAYEGNRDFGHTSPDWDAVMTLGIPGLKARALGRVGEPMNPDFAQAQELVWTAAENFCLRCAAAADKCGKKQMADGMRNLVKGAPKTLFEAMQLTLVYYTLQQFMEGTILRTLGRLDRMFAPFYIGERDDTLFDDFIREIDALRVTTNMPFAIGGTDKTGACQVNEVSYLLLDAYARLKPADTKLHILCTPDMPRDLLAAAMRSIREGGNSIIFMNDRKIVEGLSRLGMSREDAADYAVVGCYEPSARGEVPCSCNGIVNVPKALELALHNGCDGITGQRIGPETMGVFTCFEDLYWEFSRQLELLVQGAIRLTCENERMYPSIHAAPFFSATMESCVVKGGDVYCDGAAKYNNSSINAIGLATAVDSLAAIRKLVFEEKRMTLTELTEILDKNWEGHETLQGIIRTKYPKYGNGDKIADDLAVRIFDSLSDMVNGRPNARGGVCRLGVFSIDWRTPWGKGTAASADGRNAGEPISQNASAAFGADREGATGHILSITALDAAKAVNGTILDLDMHISAVRGDKGLQVLLAGLDTFLSLGGQGIHYNILDTDTLEDARENPEKHPNLQVRLCGWNVRFTELSRDAQNEYIRRSKHQMG